MMVMKKMIMKTMMVVRKVKVIITVMVVMTVMVLKPVMVVAMMVKMVVMKTVMTETSARSLTCCQFLHSVWTQSRSGTQGFSVRLLRFIAGETERQRSWSKVTPPSKDGGGAAPALALASAPPPAARLLLAAPGAPLAFPDRLQQHLTLSFLAHPGKL